MEITEKMQPLLIVISGPSGVGKDSVLAEMKKLNNTRFHYSVTTTTRKQRPGEIDGVDYNFVTQKQFNELFDSSGFIESANVYGQWYGVPKDPLRDALRNHKDVIVKIDVQGARTIKELVPDAVLIFLNAPSKIELERRLKKRKTETLIDINRRLSTAILEMKESEWFDHVITNQTDDIKKAVVRILDLIEIEKSRTPPRVISL